MNSILKRSKTGGRQKGTPNKVATESRQLMSDFVNRRITSILDKEEEIEAMDIEKQIKLIQPLLPYVMSKIADQSDQEQNQPRHPKTVFRQHIGPGEPKVYEIY